MGLFQKKEPMMKSNLVALIVIGILNVGISFCEICAYGQRPTKYIAHGRYTDLLAKCQGRPFMEDVKVSVASARQAFTEVAAQLQASAPAVDLKGPCPYTPDVSNTGLWWMRNNGLIELFLDTMAKHDLFMLDYAPADMVWDPKIQEDLPLDSIHAFTLFQLGGKAAILSNHYPELGAAGANLDATDEYEVNVAEFTYEGQELTWVTVSATMKANGNRNYDTILRASFIGSSHESVHGLGQL
jgi:hypothetical protein